VVKQYIVLTAITQQIINHNKILKMKNIVSNIEGNWKELKKVDLTTEQKELLYSQKEEDKELKLELVNSIKLQREVTLTSEESVIYQDIYERVKPVLKVGDTYQLIGINIYIDSKTSGILNCRVNSEHKQIRF
jgi:hypothetical protein